MILAGTYAFLGDKVKAYKYLDEFAEKNSFSFMVDNTNKTRSSFFQHS